MSLGVAIGAQMSGGDIFAVRAEARVTNGAAGLSIVGLGDKAVGEARERVASALETSNLLSLASRAARVVVSLSPSDKKKTGSHLDLAIAVSCLAASKVTDGNEETLLLGELGLDGSLLPCRGALAMAEAAVRAGARYAIVPAKNAAEVAALGGLRVFSAQNLREVAMHLSRRKLLPEESRKHLSETASTGTPSYDIARGQREALRAAEVAMAGSHSFAMIGPPGTGKTTVAKACAEIMPPLPEEEAIEVARTLSLAGLEISMPVTRPFRAPHHTATYAALVGGGQDMRPGEAARAHRGVLFLDELPEFDRRALDALREPVEEGVVRISRAAGSVTFPARFTLVAAMNPCPCGFAGDDRRECSCPPGVAAKYGSRVSGPLADRIDVWARVSSPKTEEVLSPKIRGEEGASARKRVAAARERQLLRARRSNLPLWTTNSELPDSVMKAENFSDGSREILVAAAEKLSLSARGVTRAMRVALTIADLAGEDQVSAAHALEAVGYRNRHGSK